MRRMVSTVCRRHAPAAAPAMPMAALLLPLLALGASAIVGVQVAHADEAPPSMEELGHLITMMQDSIATNPPEGDLPELSQARNPNAPAALLYDGILRLEALLDQGGLQTRVPVRRSGLIARAHESALLGFRRYGSGDLPGTVRALRKAVSSLHASSASPLGRQDAVTPIAMKFATAAGRIAERVVEALETRRGRLGGRGQRHLDIGDLLLSAGQYVAATGQYGGALNIASRGPAFDIDLFEQNIRDALSGETIGYAYTIGRGGQLYTQDGVGQARTVADPPAASQSATKEMYIASVSKTISSLALLIALDERGISVDDGIRDHLPAAWTKGPGVASDTVTFRHLLTHTSGLKNLDGGQDLDTMKDVIAEGSTGLVDFDDAPYVNSNFALMRILVPQIWAGQAVIDGYTSALPEDFVYAALYSSYVKSRVLAPAGINVSGCSPGEPSSSRTLYYSTLSPSDPGRDLGDWSLLCGATGWYLSTNELGSLLAHLRYTETIIDDEIRDLMNDGYLGWLNPITFSEYVEGVFGVYRAHGGDFPSGSNPGMTACMMNYPINVEASLLINSRGGAIGGHPCTVLRDAFDEAWH